MSWIYRFVVFTSITLLLVAGCAVKKVPKTTGGSREDGIIEMSYEWGMFEDTEVQWDKARKKAVKRCQLWGYSDAKRFGSGVKSCTARNNQGNCVRMRATITYQCIGKND